MQKKKYTNRVTMEGCVTDIGLAAGGADVTVCTQADGTDEGTVCHRVHVVWPGPVPEAFRRAGETCAANAAALSGDCDPESLLPVWVRLEGRLLTDAGGDYTACEADGAEIMFARGDMYAEIEAQGQLMARAVNDLCAAAAVDAGLRLNMSVLRSGNPDKWEELGSDRTRKGDILSFRAPLTSAYMSNGKDGHWQCRAVAGTYRNLSLEKREAAERKRDTGRGLTA